MWPLPLMRELAFIVSKAGHVSLPSVLKIKKCSNRPDSAHQEYCNDCHPQLTLCIFVLDHPKHRFPFDYETKKPSLQPCFDFKRPGLTAHRQKTHRDNPGTIVGPNSIHKSAISTRLHSRT